MYAVIISGGKQYRVTAGDTITVNKLDAKEGDTLKIDQVMALSGDKTVIGTPHVTGALVEAQVIAQTRNDTVIVFKKKRRQHYRRKNGHRQPMTKLFITSVSLNGTSLASKEPRKLNEKKAAPAAKKTEKKAAAKPAAKKAPAAKKQAAKKA
jgi:large subunit ribosomal protein L21